MRRRTCENGTYRIVKVTGNRYVLGINRHRGRNTGDRVDCIRYMGIQDAAGGKEDAERGFGKAEEVQRGVCGIRKEDGNFQEAGTETRGEKVESRVGDRFIFFQFPSVPVRRFSAVIAPIRGTVSYHNQ